MEVKSVPTGSVEKYLAAFHHSAKDILFDKREAAAKALAELGFPSSKDEAWKYTDLRAITTGTFTLSEETNVNPSIGNIPESAHVMVFVNGKFDAKRSSMQDLPSGAILCDVKSAIEKHQELVRKYFAVHVSAENTFSAINTALANEGILLFLPAGVNLGHPLVIRHIQTGNSTNTLCNFRNMIICESGSSAKISEEFISETLSSKTEPEYFVNSVTEVFAAEGAQIDFCSVKSGSAKALHVDQVYAVQKKSSRFSSYSITLNGATVRNNLTIRLDEERTESEMYGLFLAAGKNHFDNHTLIDHAKPNCHSNQLYKGIASDESSAVFNGKIMVRRDAQKTNAFQSNKNILLSDKATVNSKPQLEIFADDVKCSHGATTGQLDKEALFYLQARGISRTNAIKLLVEAFAGEVIEKIPFEYLKEELNTVIARRLN